MLAARSRSLIFSLALVSALWAGTASAHASCAEPLPLDQALAQADTVFVGTVTSLDHGDRIATFRVDETWRGDLGATVIVSGGPSPAELEAARAEGLDMMTSVDRTYVAGATYLVVAHGREGEVLLDNACSATQVWTDDLGRHRPAVFQDTVVVPPAESGSGVAIRIPWVGVAALLVGGAGLAAVAFHSRKLSRTGRSVA